MFFVGSADAGVSEKDARRLAEFFQEDGCCLGAWFSEVVQKRFDANYLAGGAACSSQHHSKSLGLKDLFEPPVVCFCVAS